MIDPDILATLGHIVNFDMFVKAWNKVTGNDFWRNALLKST